jgi:hypothetical protein
MFGYSADEAVGAGFAMLFPEHAPAEIRGLWNPPRTNLPGKPWRESGMRDAGCLSTTGRIISIPTSCPSSRSRSAARCPCGCSPPTSGRPTA